MEPFAFVEEKLAFVHACITEVEDQLCVRKTTHDALCHEISVRICSLHAALGAQHHRLDGRALSLDHAIKDLERERRSAEVEFLRDCAHLQRELRALKKEYRTLRGMMP